MKRSLLSMYIALLFPRMADGDGGPADKTVDNTKDVEPSLRDTLEASYDASVEGKGGDTSAISEAARTLAKQRKTGEKTAPIDKIDDATIKESERVAAENKKKAEAESQAAAAKKKRDAELAAMPEEQRKQAIADDEKKAAEAKKAADEAAAAAKLEAPAHWPADVREMFGKQPPEVKKFLLERHKAMEADYTKKTQELAPLRKMAEVLDDVFKPSDEEMRMNGITREAALRELFGIHARMKKDPVAGLKYLAEISGVDIKTLATTPSADPGEESPVVRGLRDQVSKLSATVEKLTGHQNAAADEARLTEVNQFAEEKDEKGQLKRPYFDEVAKDVARLIRGAKAAGEQITLQQAYDQAVYANPTTRAKLLAASDAERKAKEEKERQDKAAAAKKAAGADVDGQGSAAAVEKKSDGSIRGDLAAAWDAQMERV